jgi:A/G-specific adenine glycosylase
VGVGAAGAAGGRHGTETGSIAAKVVASWQSSGVDADRDRLPWRSPPSAADPWHVLVSEVMLAQTQAGRVADRFPQFVERFGSPSALAAEPLGEMLRAWQGLGYPRRAANLHRCAGVLVADHDGEVPRELEVLLALPGVGRYTARAVLAFAFDVAIMPVDTNIGRVLARLQGRRLGVAEAQRIGDSLQLSASPAPGGRRTGLAFMDLGAVLCRPKEPGCPECPLVTRCVFGLACSVAEARGRPAPEDPAVRSAGVSGRQARFEGSDRQGRGRLLKAAAGAPIAAADLAVAAGWPDDPARAARAVMTLVADGLLAAGADGRYVMP